jgi:hypothetical protein
MILLTIERESKRNFFRFSVSRQSNDTTLMRSANGNPLIGFGTFSTELGGSRHVRSTLVSDRIVDIV